MAVIVFLEIWSKFPKFSKQEIRLTIFRIFYAISFVALFIWFILDYRAFIKQEPALASVMLVILFFFLMATLLSGFPEDFGPSIWKRLDKTKLEEKTKDFVAVISFLAYAGICTFSSFIIVSVIYALLTASWW
jgi:cation transport ATPase